MKMNKISFGRKGKGGNTGQQARQDQRPGGVNVLGTCSRNWRMGSPGEAVGNGKPGGQEARRGGAWLSPVGSC